MKNNDCSILINSCDKYSDVWEPFFWCLKDYYTDCPYPIYLNTETKTFSTDLFEVNCVNTKAKCNWGKRFIKALKEIDTKYVIVILDDFFLRSPVSQDKINKYIQLLENRQNLDCIYLLPQNKGEYQSDDEGLLIIPEGADYRLSTGPAIWKRERLLKYIKPIDDPWAWEFFGSIRAENQNTLFYCSNDYDYDFDYEGGGAIHRGKWVKSVVEPVLKKHELSLNINDRGIEDINETTKGSFWFNIKFSFKGFLMVGFKAFRFTIRANKERIRKVFRKNGN